MTDLMIGQGLLGVRLLLAVVFSIAGTAKLADSGGSAGAVRAFGGPARGARAIAIALGVAELGIAAGLVITAAAWGAAVGALALLALLSLVVGRSLRRGDAPVCHCFGRLHAARAGGGTLVRNGVLAAAAIAVLVAGGPSAAGASATHWVTRLDEPGWIALAGAVACAAVLLAAGWLVTELLRRHGRLIARVEQLEEALVLGGLEVPAPADLSERPSVSAGEAAPAFELPDLDGRPVALADLLAPGGELALVFASPSCHPCRALLRSLADAGPDPRGRRVVVIGDGSAQEWRALPADLAPETLLLQRAGEVAERYGADVTPTAIVMSGDGVIAAPPAPGASAARELLLAAPLADHATPAIVPVLVGQGGAR